MSKFMPEPAMSDTQQSGLVRLFDRGFETRHRFGHEFAADVVVAYRRADGVTRDGHAFDQCMRVVAENLPVVTGAGLALVRVADNVLLAGQRSGHETPLQARGKAGPAAAPQTRRLDGGYHLLGRKFAGKDPAPCLISAMMFVGFELPGLIGVKSAEAHQVLLHCHHSSPSSISSTRCFVRFS